MNNILFGMEFGLGLIAAYLSASFFVNLIVKILIFLENL